MSRDLLGDPRQFPSRRPTDFLPTPSFYLFAIDVVVVVVVLIGSRTNERDLSIAPRGLFAINTQSWQPWKYQQRSLVRKKEKRKWLGNDLMLSFGCIYSLAHLTAAALTSVRNPTAI